MRLDHLLSKEICRAGKLFSFEGLERAYSSVRLERTPDKREVSGSNPLRPTIGDIAQLGERLPCKQEVSGSNPLISTKKSKMYLENYTGVEW